MALRKKVFENTVGKEENEENVVLLYIYEGTCNLLERSSDHSNSGEFKRQTA